MLVQLHIENYALVERAVVEFGPGFNVMTGETGAGKSMILGALGLVLGQRASTDVLRADTRPTLVEALFDIASYTHLPELFGSLGITLDEPSLLLKRVLTKSGSRCYINAQLATVTMLQQTGQYLVDILGQHQQQTLLQREQQLALLDSYGKLSAESAALRQAYEQYRALEQTYRRVRQEEQQRQQRQDVLQFQLQEIEQAQLQPGEEERLTQERHLLLNAERLYALSQEAYAALYRDETSALAMLTTALERLSQLTALDPSQSPLHDDLQQSYYLMEEAARSLQAYGDRMEVDPARLQVIEERLGEIARLQRKYGATITDVLQHYDTLRREQQDWERQGERLQALTADILRARQALKSLAVTLSDKRRQAAERLQQAVQQELWELNMASTVFQVAHSLRYHPQGELRVGAERVGLTADGIDEVEYLFAPNPGHPPRPLARIASGGELSRVMLAIKSILAREDHIPTLIFDEVDAGIGGKTAKIVGEKLGHIARSHQVLCITHLPQIASYGDQHYRIAKSVQANHTITQIEPLDFSARVEEIARMSGGKEITDTTRKHAKEMLTRHP
ncbi:MAG: DNA repair protein RecN [Candidatus Tectimicrobiota bacterium]